MRKAALHNLGCKVNSYETEAMTQLLEKSGYEIVDFTEIALVHWTDCHVSAYFLGQINLISSTVLSKIMNITTLMIIVIFL